MTNGRKPGEHHLVELADLRRRIAELEALNSEQQSAIRSLHESHEQLRLIMDALPTLISYVDSDLRYRFNNRAYEEWFGLSEEELHGSRIRDVLGEAGYCEIQDYVELALSGKTVSHERTVRFKDGTLRHVIAVYIPHFNPKGEVCGFISLGLDDTERCLAEEALQKAHDELEMRVEERTAQLRSANERMGREIEVRRRAEERQIYLSMRDSLTGLYNRTYFEGYINQLEREGVKRVGILVCDLDGLKLINDSFGREIGDKLLTTSSKMIARSSSPFGTAARIGEDEFAVIFLNTGRETVEKSRQRIRESVAAYNMTNPKAPLSISIGVAFRATESPNMDELFREAGNRMCREKLLSSRSARNAMLQTLMRALEARDYVTEGHLNRLQEMVSQLGSVIGLPESGMASLRLLAQFHDIGKVGIPDMILFKPEQLTCEETQEMRRHCEIGHRIALASPDLAWIADWILKHHESWNGEGYPLGLKGEEIPLECRILAIADAYDAMTNTRPYRRALEHEDAVAELQRCAGTQFDPELVLRFIPSLSQTRN